MTEAARIEYTNHRGERQWYTIVPQVIRFGISPYHPERQWLLEAVSIEKQARRTFALQNIHQWNPVKE